MRHAAAAFAATVALLAGLRSQAVPTGFVVDTLLTAGLTAPNDFCFLPDGRILVASGPGAITVFANGASAPVGTVPGIGNLPECGLLSLCADPAFATNGHLYVWYASSQSPFARRLERFTCTGDLASATSTNLTFAAASARVVLDLSPPAFGLHNGGTVRFGPDGRLYLCCGDTGPMCDAQDLSSLAGKLLRLDVAGLPAGPSAVPPTAAQLDPGDNPFSSATDWRQLTIGAGLRNPFRMEIDPATGNLYVADVGGTQQEEIDEHARGAGPVPFVNFGWPWREGTVAHSHPTITCTPVAGLVDPIVSLPQSEGWVAAIGGPRYRNTNGASDFGGSHEGTLFVADHYDGRVLRFARDAAGTWVLAPAVAGQPAPDRWATGLLAVTSLQTGPDGALYLTRYASIHGFGGGGMLQRIRPVSGNRVVVVAGDGQLGPAHEPFAAPLVARALDAGGAPLPGTPVTFAVGGPGVLTTSGPVIADANGFAQTSVVASGGGAITVTASMPGTPRDAVFALFARRLTVTHTPVQVRIELTNASAAAAPLVPAVLLASLPGIPPLPTPFGPVCTAPFHPLTIVLEDSLGIFGFASLSGTGAIGTPGFVKVYALPTAVLAGLTLQFQAVGFDPAGGLFRTNCELTTF